MVDAETLVVDFEAVEAVEAADLAVEAVLVEAALCCALVTACVVGCTVALDVADTFEVVFAAAGAVVVVLADAEL